MSIYRSWTDAQERAGGNTYDYADQLVNGVRNFACNLWGKFPDRVAGSPFPSGFTRGFMNQGCRDIVTVPPPVSQFTGGQCFTQYRIYGTYTSQSNRIGRHTCGETAFWATRPVNGKILSARFLPSTFILIVTIENQDGSRLDFDFPAYYRISETSSPTTNIPGYWDTCQFDNIIYAGNAPIIEGLERLDGQADDCGDSPPVYPPSLEPTADDLNDTVNVDNYDTTNTNIPVGLVNVTGNVNVDLEMPVSFNLGGIDVSVDMGGITLNNSLGNSTYNNSVSINNNAGNVTGIGNKNPLPLPKPDREPAPPPENPLENDLDEEETTDEEPKTKPIVEGLEFVQVNITSKPDNAKNQWGDGAPDVYYCGWFEFTADGYAFNRQPIHFLQSIFKPPLGATGYAFTLYNGFTGNATIYTRKPSLLNASTSTN